MGRVLARVRAPAAKYYDTKKKADKAIQDLLR